ncbi:hypothetical protein M9Y10_029663 [Tritrichomonas musculus]|uniref:Protein kinase domain-containing protein n=1 Tax=Tritrichomonas musculus TaxID=1915356 RepID=A0ABR2KMV4_9EUKA
MTTVDIILENKRMLHIPNKIGKYHYVRSIGSGSFSAVILVQQNNPSSDECQNFACKVVSRVLLVEENMLNRFEQETRILQSLQHPNIVHVEEIVYLEDYICIIMEFCENGELFKYIVNNESINEQDCKKIFRQIVFAVQFVHQHSIAHRDLKPENILLDKDLNPKLADFGFCHITSDTLLTTPCGSPFYAPPEIIANEPYDGKKADIWSLGVVLFTMVTGALPWTEVSQSKLFIQIKNADYDVPRNLSNHIQMLIKSMLVKDPSQRPTCEEILDSPFLKASSLSYHSKLTSFGSSFFESRNINSSSVFSSIPNSIAGSRSLAANSGLLNDQVLFRRRSAQEANDTNLINLSPSSFTNIPPVSKKRRNNCFSAYMNNKNESSNQQNSNSESNAKIVDTHSESLLPPELVLIRKKPSFGRKPK